MGQPKPMLAWEGKTLVEYQVGSLLTGGADEVIVVTGRSDAEVAPIIERMQNARRAFNPDFAQGKSTSVRAGVNALPDDIGAIMLLAVDQPRPAWVVKRVLDSHLASGAPLTSPRYRGHGGHPLVFSGELRDELAQVTEEKQGIREVFQRHEARMNSLVIDNEVVRLDLNTPEAYESALKTYPEIAVEQ